MSWSHSKWQQKANARCACHAALPKDKRLPLDTPFLTRIFGVLRTTGSTRVPSPTSARHSRKSGLSRGDNDHIEDRTRWEN